LINKGANINAEDIAGRTPLHIAAGKNHIESLKILLFEMADPFKRDKEGKQAIDMTTDNKCKFYLSRARIVKTF
jgi:ankyrin repeat protein